MDVQQISSLALRRAQLGLEQNLDLHLAVRIVRCGPDTPRTKLRGEQQAKDAHFQLPHLATLHSWQLPKQSEEEEEMMEEEEESC